MEHTPKHIDDIFRERLQEAAPPPPAFVWENVERELRKRRRRGFFWMFTLGIAGLGMLGIWLANDLKQGSSASGIQTAETGPMPPSSGDISAPPSGVIAAPVKNDLETTKSPAPVVTASNQTKSSLKPGALTAITIGELASPARKPASGLNNITDNQRSIKGLDPQKLNAPESTFTLGQSMVGAAVPMLPLLQQSLAVSIKPAIPGIDKWKEAWPVVQNAPLAKAKAKKSVKNCYDFGKQPSAWFIEGYVGPSLAQRELVASPDDRPYLNKRIKTEERSVAYNAGLRASLMLKGNLLLRTGVHYDQMTEVFEYIDPSFVRTIVENVYDPVTGLTTLDTIAVEYGEKYQKTYNRFGMLDIPVMAGVELRKGRSGFNINAGVSFNLIFWKRGAILSPVSGEPAWFSPQNGTSQVLEVFKPRTGASATASVQWFYHLKPRLRIFVEPYFKKILRPVTLRSHPVEQRYGIGGLRFGLTKILN